jgi:hypothetical protein
MAKHLEKFGSIGAVVAAAACPICFPKLALLGGLLGLGAFGVYEAQLFVAAQALVLVALAGHAFAYRQHRRAWLLASALLLGAAVFAGLYLFGSEWLSYAGFAGLLALSSFDLWASRRKLPVLSSVLTCPKCGNRRRETMPREMCQFFYECRGCGAVLRPLPGDCCVFCSYGTVKCPPMQLTTTA